jgi:tetratricopeptide (TPR) repeat protein
MELYKKINTRQPAIAIAALAISAMIALVFISGCAPTVKPKEEPANTAIKNTGPTIEKLPGMQRGFVVTESPMMDKDAMADFDRANSLAKEGKNDKAAEIMESVIQKNPQLASPHINAAFIYMHMGKYDQAENHFKSALAIIPNHPVAANEYGLLLRKNGKFNDARQVYEKSIEAFPDYLPLHRNLGILCDIYLNDPACALREFKFYSTYAPTDEKVKLWISEISMRLGKK